MKVSLPQKPSLKPNLDQIDTICEDAKGREKVEKFLEMYSSPRLYTDWCMITCEYKRQ